MASASSQEKIDEPTRLKPYAGSNPAWSSKILQPGSSVCFARRAASRHSASLPSASRASACAQFDSGEHERSRASSCQVQQLHFTRRWVEGGDCFAARWLSDADGDDCLVPIPQVSYRRILVTEGIRRQRFEVAIWRPQFRRWTLLQGGRVRHPTQPLCTLRVRHYCRLTQHSLPGGLLGLTWAGLAPADRASFAWRLR